MPGTLLHHAKRMRHAPTAAETVLWRELRAHRFHGYKFRRQQPLGDYIVDFVCFRSKLVIEVDGSQHIDDAVRDAMRTAWLQSQGFTVLRFWNHDVLARREHVMDAVYAALRMCPSPGLA